MQHLHIRATFSNIFTMFLQHFSTQRGKNNILFIKTMPQGAGGKALIKIKSGGANVTISYIYITFVLKFIKRATIK